MPVKDRKYIIVRFTLLVLAGFSAGQFIALIIETAFTYFSFIPLLLLLFFTGYRAFTRLADDFKLEREIKNSTLITAGIWSSLTWELLRRRFLFAFDIPKFLLLTIILYLIAYLFYRRYQK